MYSIVKFTRRGSRSEWTDTTQVLSRHREFSAAHAALLDANNGCTSANACYRLAHTPSAAQSAYRAALTDCERAIYAIQRGDNYAPHTDEMYAELADDLLRAAMELQLAALARLSELEG